MLRVHELKKSFGRKNLFSEIDWQVPSQGCYGFVGPNGVGKTTFFRILVGELEPDEGEVIHPPKSELGYLPQEATLEAQDNLLEFVLQGANRLLAMQQELDRLLALFDDSKQGKQAQLQYESLHQTFERMGGYMIQSRAREIVVGMGFSTDDFDRSLQSFSGGWRMKALLSQLLLGHPEVLLLDEPTNHLDVESIQWLEGFLRNYEGTSLVISHDRHFLNNISKGIIELTPKTVEVFPGSYDHYIKAKKERRALQIKQSIQQQKEIEKLEAWVERFRYKATKAKQVQSREKVLNQMKQDHVSVDALVQAGMHFSFPVPERMGRVVLNANEITKSFGDHTLYDEVSLTLERGQKVALVGPNGAGKTTLLNMLAGQTKPDAGWIERGHNVTISHFAQHSVDQLNMENTLLKEMMDDSTPETAPQVRHILGAFGFSGEDVSKQISVLSGGEKTRLALAKLLLKPAGCLMLDEPTNHLDMLSREMLEQALDSFEGAVCVVSHDRYFLSQFVNKVVHIQDGQLVEYIGDYAYYTWKREQLEEGEGQSPSEPKKQAPVELKSRKAQRQALAVLQQARLKETKSLRKQNESLEASIQSLEEAHSELESTLADPDFYSSGDVEAVTKSYKKTEQQLESAMEQWEQVQAQLEVIQQKYALEEARIKGAE